MALPSSGQISLGNIATEFGGSAPHSMSEYVGQVGKSASAGQNVSFSNFHGKSASFQVSLTISSNTTNYNFRTAIINAGWDQVKPVIATCTINSGVYVYSTSTGAYAWQTGTSFPAGSSLSLVNNGTIIGRGGNGGGGGSSGGNGGGGAGGGPALYAGAGISITNNGRISGGGGGGGGGGAA